MAAAKDLFEKSKTYVDLPFMMRSLSQGVTVSNLAQIQMGGCFGYRLFTDGVVSRSSPSPLAIKSCWSGNS